MTQAWWVNGTIVPAGVAAIAPDDHGLTVGDGVFTTIAVRDGVPLAITRHLARLRAGLDAVGILAPDDALILAGVDAAMRAAGDGIGRLRITVTSGPGPVGLGRGQEPTVTVWAGPGVTRPTCAAVTAPWRLNERGVLAGVKSTSYGERAALVAYAHARQADECLLANTAGDLCEGIGSNVFVERGGEVLTPALDSGCLPGIMRGLILEWGADAGLAVREAAPGELRYAVLDEVAAGAAVVSLSSATRGLQGLDRLDGVGLEHGTLLGRLAMVVGDRLLTETDPPLATRRTPM